MPDKIGAVMVVGGGISGVQAALDLANSGFKVYLVDKAPSIGGKMAQLDKTFPTNDCAMCILSPKLVECERNPNITIISYAEVASLDGEPGNFKVTVVRKPRYVDEEKCAGCRTCADYCPVKIPDAYNENLSVVKCIHIPFAQAIPAVSVVDPSACLYFTKGQCNICVQACKRKAINLRQPEERLEIEVGAVILAAGYDTFDPRTRFEYGYGKLANVLTSLEFERILSAAGPYQGEIRRPADRKPPKKIAWIQCVGSRNTTIGNGYCSAVCCMYAIKQAVMVKEHDEAVETTIFHNDVRAFGKGFERYYERAKNDLGIRFVWGAGYMAQEVPQTKNVVIRYPINEAQVNAEEFDLVVLSVGLTPPSTAAELAQKLLVEVNPHGFIKDHSLSPVETSRPGIYLSGAIAGPMDIPESVTMASGAASLCCQLLSEQRGTLTTGKEYPEERDVFRGEPRVGVFVCRCGTNIGRVVDVPSVAKYVRTLENVTYAEEQLFACSIDSMRHMAETIREQGLNRVVVAACTPRTHEPVFQETLREAGLNPHLFEMANIREHCSWVHMRQGGAATQKAKELVEMAVAKARLLEPLKPTSLGVIHTGVVIGGGVAGMICALDLAQQGFEVSLVEKTEELGGMARQIHYTLEGNDVQAYVTDLVSKVSLHPLINVYRGAEVLQVSGYVGNFTTAVKLLSGKVIEIEHGVTVVATGGGEYRPTEYLYGKHPGILTSLELEEEIANNGQRLANCRTVVMIQCVGSREEPRLYCSRVCCAQSIKNALKLKKLNPRMNIYILYRDIRTYGFREDYYREAADQDVRFIRFDVDDKPEVAVVEQEGQSGLRVTVSDSILGERLAIDADLIALAAATTPAADNRKLSQLLKVPLNEDGFFVEAHMKLRPVEFANDGIFLCGLAHSPKQLEESIVQAEAAASKAAALLAKDSIPSEAAVAYIDRELCSGCKYCLSVCPYNAISFDSGHGVAEVNSVLCKGCGNCVAACPSAVCSIAKFEDRQVLAQVEPAAWERQPVVKRERFEPKIIAFLCNWCSYAGSDLAGVSRLQYPPGVRVIRTMCSSRIDPLFVIKAIGSGIDGVLVSGCHPGECHYLTGNYNARRRMAITKKFLEYMGVEPQRIQASWVSASEGTKFAEVVTKVTDELKEIGPNKLFADEA